MVCRDSLRSGFNHRHYVAFHKLNAFAIPSSLCTKMVFLDSDMIALKSVLFLGGVVCCVGFFGFCVFVCWFQDCVLWFVFCLVFVCLVSVFVPFLFVCLFFVFSISCFHWFFVCFSVFSDHNFSQVEILTSCLSGLI